MTRRRSCSLQLMKFRLAEKHNHGEGHSISMRFSVVTGFKIKELTSWAKVHLMPKSLVISDGLACFKGVEKADVFHRAIVTGGEADCVKLPYFQWVITKLNAWDLPCNKQEASSSLFGSVLF